MASAPIMSKYEMTTLIGVRMEQLAFGAPSTLPKDTLQTLTSIREIAREELRQKRIPLLVTRQLTNNTTQQWSANDMIPPRIE